MQLRFAAVVMRIDNRPYLSLRQRIIIMRKVRTARELTSFSALPPASVLDQPAAHDVCTGH